MRKLLVCVFAFVFSMASLNAQDGNAPIRFGAKAGVNFSDITGDMTDSFTGRTAFHVGVVAEIPLSESFAIQPELIYSSQGSDYEDEFDGFSFDGTVKVDFLNIPVMAKYFVADGFTVEAGPQIGILLSAKDEYDGGDDDIKDFVKGIDFGVNFGLGYQLDNGLNFAARYNLGLTDLNDSPADSFDSSEYRNSVIQLSVGYFFN